MAWPSEEHSSGRPCRRSPLYDVLKASGAVFGDLRAALYDSSSRPFLRNYILGLGGRSYKTSDFCAAMRESVEIGSEPCDHPSWIGLNR